MALAVAYQSYKAAGTFFSGGLCISRLPTSYLQYHRYDKMPKNPLEIALLHYII